jgi:LAO/AO transport system kinase
MVRDTVIDRLLSDPGVKDIRAEVEREVRDGELTAALGAQRIIDTASRT